jgi:hypothetical protein
MAVRPDAIAERPDDQERQEDEQPAHDDRRERADAAERTALTNIDVRPPICSFMHGLLPGSEGNLLSTSAPTKKGAP